MAQGLRERAMTTRFDIARRLSAALFALTAALAVAGPAQAQDWPQRPVRIIGPYAAGGNADVLARLTAQRLSEAFGQQFIVENRVGGNGVIAAETVARAPADGYTLMWGVLPPVAIQPNMAKVPYDPIKDFAPISVVGTNPFVLVVNKDIPVKNVAEFIAWVKSQPKKLSYAEGAVGSVTHLAMALFLKRAGLEMTNVSYRGNAPALTDIVAGHIPTMFSNVSDALPQIRAGAIRPLAVSSAASVPQLPGVPTVAASFPGYMAITWNGLMAPAGTPKPIVDKMAAEIARACKDPKFIERLANLGADPLGNTPQEFAALIAADLKTWGEAVAVAGLKK
jgi:tripartite-type tricarboxylate transporter receptor subunit TctC